MNDATEAALGLLGLSPTNIQPPSPIIPSKRKQYDQPSTPVVVQPEAMLDEGIECICGFTYDDGFSIACDKCSRWVHAACYGIVDAEEVNGCAWMCVGCEPRQVDVEAAKKLQVEKRKAMEAGRNGGTSGASHKSRVGGGKPRRPSAVANSVDGPSHGKKKRRPSIINPSTSQTSHVDDEHIDVGDSWAQSFVPIPHDIVNHQETREKLRRHAQNWRGVTALSPQQETLTTVRPVSIPPSPYSNPAVRPPSYALHTTAPIQCEQLIAPYTSTIMPSAAYLSDPLNAYAHLGIPKPFVHLIGHPLDVALDSRWQGDKSRFARSGCRPNAVLRPMLCSRSPTTDTHDDRLSFGVFALRDLKANEEVILGWEWDDGNAIHSLPAAIQTPHLFRYPPDSREDLEYLRRQMSIIIHTLSSTFTTCACGSRSRDCAIALAGAFVDGDVSPAMSPGSGPSKTPQVDLGPLVGTERGFRTRERIPSSGGMYGVEMWDAVSTSPKGKGKARAMDNSVDSPVAVEGELGSAVYSGREPDARGEQPSPIRTTKRLPRKRVRTDLPPPADPPPPLLPPRPPEDITALREPPGREDMDVDMDVDGNEDKMPPKMRKRWIHRSLDALKQINQRCSESPVDEGMGLGLSNTSGTQAELAEASSSGGTNSSLMDIDTSVHPHRPEPGNMPPPPMPASLDPTTVSSISLTHPSPRPNLASFDLLPAFNNRDHAHPSNPLTTSPTTSFANLSLLSPVVIHGSPPLVKPESATSTAPTTSLKSNLKLKSPSPSPKPPPPTPPSETSSLLSDAHPRATELSAETDVDHEPDRKVRFTSPPSIDLPASLQRRQCPLPRAPTPPPLLHNELTAEPSIEEPLMQDNGSGDGKGVSLDINIATTGEVRALTHERVDQLAEVDMPTPRAPTQQPLPQPPSVIVSAETNMDVDEPTKPILSLSPPPPSSTESTAPEGVEPNAPPPEPDTIADVVAQQAQPHEQEVARPLTPPPPQKVKLSLKDFAMRKKKMREEVAKASPVIGSEPVDMAFPQSPSLNAGPISVDEDRRMSSEAIDESKAPDGASGVEHIQTEAGDEGKMDVDVDGRSECREVEYPGAGCGGGDSVDKASAAAQSEIHSDASSQHRRSESHSDPSVHTPPSSTPPLTPRTPPGHSPPPSTASRSPSPPDLGEKENECVDRPNHPISLQAKVELIEQVMPSDNERHVLGRSRSPEILGSYRSLNGINRSPPPVSRPIPEAISRGGTGHTANPVYPEVYRGHYRRPSHEDGEITSTRSEASPPLPSIPLPTPPPPAPPIGPKAYNGVNGSFNPRINPPPTAPRFHPGHSPPSFPTSTSRRPNTSFSYTSVPSPAPISASSASASGSKHPPIGPRASRASHGRPYQPPLSYQHPPPPPRSTDGLPRGPSADRDRRERLPHFGERSPSWTRNYSSRSNISRRYGQ